MTNDTIITWISNESTNAWSVNEYMLGSYKYADKYIDLWHIRYKGDACIGDKFIKEVAIEAIKEVQKSWHISQ